ncbi:hypothetical protein [Bilophila wadsworthia]|uniref:hypothetical protein n=1 Tax=Bilophila wadsworthia TaxID=35833 RepID=UPI003A86B461
MKLKLDENGHVVVKDGFPVWVAEDGAEIAYNVPDLVNKISAVNAESAGRRKDIDALTSQLKAFDGIDPEKAKAALETVANLDAGKLIDAGKVDDLRWKSRSPMTERFPISKRPSPTPRKIPPTGWPPRKPPSARCWSRASSIPARS